MNNKKHSDETKELLRKKALEFNKINPTFYKDLHRHHSEESKEKIRKKNIGRKQSAETIEKIKQYKPSYEQKKKISDSKKLWWKENTLYKTKSEETKEKMSLGHKGKKYKTKKMITSGTTIEIWKPIHDYEGLYEISDHGRVRNVSKSNRIIGSWYSATLTNWDGEQTIFAISGLLQSHFGTKKRIVYKPHNGRKTRKEISDLPFNTRKEFIKYLDDIWCGCSGNTPLYQNYFMQFDITVDQAIERINNQLGCKSCSKVLDQINLKILWNNGDIQEISEGFLSIFCIRYWLMREGFIHFRHNLFQGLYKDEEIKWRKIVYNIWKYRPEKDTVDETELDDDGVKFMYKKGPYKVRSHGKSNNNLYKKTKEEIEIDYTQKIDYSSFSYKEKESDDIAEKIYKLLPPDWIKKDEYWSRERTSKIELNRVFEIVVNTLPQFTLCEIVNEIYIYQSAELWTFYKRLDNKWQKIILKELDK